MPISPQLLNLMRPILNLMPLDYGIQNISGKTSNGYINQLRVVLVKISTPPIPLEDFLQSL